MSSSADPSTDKAIVREVSLDQEIEGQVKEGNFAQFCFHHSGTSKLLTIEVEPKDADSDPDLYVLNSNKGDCNKSAYTWKSCLVGRDRVDVHPDDPSSVRGTYRIGVLGATSSYVSMSRKQEEMRPRPVTRFRLRVYESIAPSVITLLPNTYRTVRLAEAMSEGKVSIGGNAKLESWHYFKFKISEKPNTNFFVTSTPCIPDLDLKVYASNSVMFPNQSLSRWRAMGNGKPCTFKFDVEDFKHRKEKMCFIAVHVSDTSKTKSNKSEKISMVPDISTLKKLKGGELFKMYVEVVDEEDLLPTDFKPSLRKWKSLFEKVDGGRTSQSERRRLAVDENKSFTYGEVEFVSFCEILRCAKPKPGEIFYDLGSGTGKAIVAAHLLESFKECHGVELLDGLHKVAQNVIDIFSKDKKLWKNAEVNPSKHCFVHHADMLEHPWWEVADVVYTSSICFTKELYKELGNRFSRMKKGSRIITLKMDNIPQLKLKDRKSYKMSWGRCTVYVYEKRY
mmetsp:Transcript_21682/g.53076  ORF Transcript_21682/g.53076 Transcript_21682/m.53076 type:complete len:507 (+) Transcript_21682:302-1822(+)